MVIRSTAVSLVVGMGFAWVWKYAYIAWKTRIAMHVYDLIYELSRLSGPIAVHLDDLIFALVLAAPLSIPTWRLNRNSRYRLLALCTTGFLQQQQYLPHVQYRFSGGGQVYGSSLHALRSSCCFRQHGFLVQRDLSGILVRLVRNVAV